jgi:hypothetical protein
MPKGKAQADAKAQHSCEYVSILRRFATPPLGIRCVLEIGSAYFRASISPCATTPGLVNKAS